MESAEKSHPPIKLRLTYSEKSKTFSKKSSPENHDDRVKSLVLKSSSLTEQLSDEDTEEYDADEDPPKKSSDDSYKLSVPITRDTYSVFGHRESKPNSRLENILFRLKKPGQNEEKPISSGTSINSSPLTCIEEKIITDDPCPRLDYSKRKSRWPQKESTRREKGAQKLVVVEQTIIVDNSSLQDSSGTSSSFATLNGGGSKSGLVTNAGIKDTLEVNDTTGPSPWWTCFLCNVTFPEGHLLLLHMHEHKGTKRFPCGKCKEELPSIEELTAHFHIHVGGEAQQFGLHACRVCGKSFSREDHLERHVLLHAEEESDVVGDSSSSSAVTQAGTVPSQTVKIEPSQMFPRPALPKRHRCDRCRRVFTSSNALLLHKCRRGLVKPFGCGRCGRCFSMFTNLLEHSATHEDKESFDLKCYECHKQFPTSLELRKHALVHIEEEASIPLPKSSKKRRSRAKASKDPSLLLLSKNSQRKDNAPRKQQPRPEGYKCIICGKIFRLRSSLQHHKQTHSEKKFQCEHCNKKFTFKKSLEIHVRGHTGEKPYQCEICDRFFARQDALLKHRRLHLGVKPFICDICGRQFADRFELRRHINAHNKQKPYKCNLCEKAYSDNTRLKEHMFQHSGTMPYICERCGKGYARKYRYNLHIKQHKGEYRFKCEDCGRGFLRRSDFNTHKLTHTSERPFKCKQCGMGFIRDDYLKRHMLVHSGEKPHNCSVCGKYFARKNTLRRHLLIHRRNAEKNEEGDDYDTDFCHSATGISPLSSGMMPPYRSGVSSAFTSGVVSPLVSGVMTPLVGGDSEERDILKDIQAVIGVNITHMFE